MLIAITRTWFLWVGAATKTADEESYDTHFNHPGTSYIAAAGDIASGILWPAVSSAVVAVGGTTLTIDSSGNYLSESGWSGSGGGKSVYISRPAYQNGFQTDAMREIPDVAFNADPLSGVAVYTSQPSPGWIVVGGTSLSAPCWAGLFRAGRFEWKCLTVFSSCQRWFIRKKLSRRHNR